MPFKAQTHRVLIASPSDLQEERQAATDAVNEWNAQHAAAESVVLLPVKWETHARPAAAHRPQAVINRQVVQNCDVLVGLFWTRLGTSTGVAESGTVEEFDKFVSAGKPALLYFSRRPVDPDTIDLRQHRKLRAFRKGTQRRALTGTFAAVEELRQTLVRDLLLEVRQLKAKSRAGRSRNLDEAYEVTELIRLHRRHKIAPEEYRKYRDEVFAVRRRNKVTGDPVQPGEVGPQRLPYRLHGRRREGRVDPRRRAPRERVGASAPPQRQGDLGGVPRALGQGVVEPAPELALPDQDGRGAAHRRAEAAARAREAGGAPDRAEVWQEEPGLGRLRVGACQRPALRPGVGDRRGVE